MGDLIDRQAVLDAVRSFYDELDEREKSIEDRIAGIPPAQQWIPCSERLPEKYIGEWLCCTDEGQILVLPYGTPGNGSKECVFYRWDDKWDMYETYIVVAWMPLPEPYKGDNNG